MAGEINNVSVEEMEKILNNNADLVRHPKGLATSNAILLANLPLQVLVIALFPFLIGAVGYSSGEGMAKLGYGLFGLVGGILMTPVLAAMCVVSTAVKVLSVPVSLVVDVPRLIFSKKFRTEFKLSRNLSKLKSIYKATTNEESLLNSMTEFNRSDVRMLITEIEMLNKQLGRDNVILEDLGTVFESEPKQQSHKVYDDVILAEVKELQDDNSKDM